MHQNTDQIRKPVILVAEDEEVLRMLIAAFLHDEGYQVVEASNVSEALTAIISNHVDLVFTDINMPGKLKGDCMAKWLATHRPALPVIMTSGFESPSVEGDSQRFISKPYRLSDVASQIKDLLH
jgi:CheY-like chemotaxis protein